MLHSYNLETSNRYVNNDHIFRNPECSAEATVDSEESFSADGTYEEFHVSIYLRWPML